jgi:hypothetical protein
LRKKRIKNIFNSTLRVFLISFIIFSVAYIAIEPGIEAKAYIEHLDAASIQLRSDFNKLSQSTQSQVFNNPDLDSAKRMQELASIKTLIDQTEVQLTSFKSVSDKFLDLHHIGPAYGSFETAKATRESALNTIFQSNDVLKDYNTLISYTEKYEQINTKLNEKFLNFNSLTDLNLLIGRQQEVTQTSQEMKSYANELKNIPVPIDLKKFNDEAVASINQAARGFDDLAYGLQFANDNNIYYAASEIEQATDKNDTKDNDLFVSVADKSPILKNVVDLPDKLDQFKVVKH